jgi:hypothetical protein
MDLLNAADGGVSLSTGDAWTDVGLSNGTSPGYNPGLHETSYPADIRHICFLVFFCATSVIAPIGIVGNVFSIVVFLSAANFRRTSTVQYLIGLAITDSLYLVGELFFTLSTPTPWGTYLTSVNFVYTTDSGCKLIMWLRYRYKFHSSHLT